MNAENDGPQVPTDQFIDVQYGCFFVDNTPYCLWDFDLRKKTLEFLDGIDPSYYEYIANTHFQESVEDKSHLAALAIRTTYSQALETLFALLSASLQAPFCVPAWLLRYQPRVLRNVIEKITKHTPSPDDNDAWPKVLNSILLDDIVTWPKVVELIFESLQLDDKEKERMIKQQFTKMWKRGASPQKLYQ